ncbi:GyrI-like domain-containing protein [Gordonia hydrophobica]|uniref:GyrI-like domain-containing protein n=1 Tax=Gordonia hydrophobica TaxID=40516 RepID=A0ABZ2U4U3_9ACTN|nr:GyrI-like domain-containing protein [Gordonia hydrophobica]MBM7367964.1 effector-binding domain-containing protein [Gordonia hydrophobica]
MSSSLPLILREEPFFDAIEVPLPEHVAVVTMEFPEVQLADLPEIFDGHFHVLAEAGPIGPGFAIYEGDITDEFDLTIGFPVAGPAQIDGADNGAFPTGQALIMSHLGGFDGLGSAWETLMERHFAKGGSAPRAVVEIYVTDPSVVEHDDLRTDLLVLL